MKELERKYIDLLLQKCLNFNLAKSLLIQCDLKEHLSFAEKVKKRANELGIYDVCINLNDLDEIHNYLQSTPVEDIKLNPLIDKKKWDIYSLKGASILLINTVVPGLMDDIPTEKIQKWLSEEEKVIDYFSQNVGRYVFPWCIANMPNERWAKTIFHNDEKALEKLFIMIMKMCMIDKTNPIAAWEAYINENNIYKNKLNSLNISSLHYTNSLGTDLTIGLPNGIRWLNIDNDDSNSLKMIANMPSYEIFTTPDYRTTNGIVFASRPLFYNECLIDKFYIIFENGQVVDCRAKKGEEVLKRLIFENEGANFLGEVALVPNNSPVSKTGLVFNETLLDENASCHLALGSGLEVCLPGFETMSSEELLKNGINLSEVHVDFMIGTDDLNITATTEEGPKLIFKKGKFNL